MTVDPATTRRAPYPDDLNNDSFAAWSAAETARIFAKADALRLDSAEVVVRIEFLEDEVARLTARLARYEDAA